MAKTTSYFIEKSRKRHGDKYDYSDSVYKGSKKPILIKCPIHGYFWTKPEYHYECGCADCSKSKKLDNCTFASRSKSTHGDKYDYSLVNYKNNREKVCIICSIHGEFWQSPDKHLSGQGCPKCAGKNRSREDYIKILNERHGSKYDYSLSDFQKKDKIQIRCKKHDVFYLKLSDHLKGRGCPECSKENRGKTLKKDTSFFIKTSNIVHDFKYDYSNSQYEGSKIPLVINCKEHGPFKQRPNDHLDGHGCFKCFSKQSNAEKEIFDFISSYYTAYRDRTQIKGELDIYIPELKLGIEFNGLYWHSDRYKDNYYHLNKVKECNVKGIRLIQIFEDEWLYKRDIVKSRLLNIIGKTPNILYARKCEIREVSYNESKLFLESNHIQGNCMSKVRIGLYYDSELVCLMTFGNLRKNLGNKSQKGSWELLRFCNKLNTYVIGGASRLFKYFLGKFDISSVLSYCDLRWSDGRLYDNLGFKFIGNTIVGFYYIKDRVRYNRFNYRKSVLVKQGYDSSLTAMQIMKSRGFDMIYDCGSKKYIYEAK